MKFTISDLAILTFFFLATSAQARESACKQGNQERKVSIVKIEEPKPVPCEVKYLREDGEKTLYTAHNDAAFCESKANEFVEKLKSSGWECGEFQ